MTAVFIGGSRRISRINVDVRARLDRIVENRLPILIGDANGADKAVRPEITRLDREGSAPRPAQAAMFDDDER